MITAYEARDLHTLLLLELKWIHQEQNHLETVADEKLALYLQILREQARDLELEKNQLIKHPRYFVLLDYYGYQLLDYPVKNVKDEISHLTDVHKTYQMDIAILELPNPLSHVKVMVQQWKREREHEKEDMEFLTVLMALSQRR